LHLEDLTDLNLSKRRGAVNYCNSLTMNKLAISTRIRLTV